MTDNGNGAKTVSCDDGTSVSVRDGTNGADGTDGQDGNNGQDGANGSDGFTSLIRLEPELDGCLNFFFTERVNSGQQPRPMFALKLVKPA